MIALGILLSIPGLVCAFRWFSRHSFEWYEGVSLSEQMDRDFWLAMAFVAAAMFFIVFGALR